MKKTIVKNYCHSDLHRFLCNTGISKTQTAMKTYYVYIMTNTNNKVLYIGVTNNLPRRVYEHKNGLSEGFTKKYNCKKLVWYKETSSAVSAIQEEKRMKKWKREYKENVIEELNPNWIDLYDDLVN